jgi:acyl-CoA oxidase
MLFDSGNFQGIHSFIVPIRDANYQPLPGIELGDIGPKYGFMTKDNGYMLMKNVRIPRKNMLRRYVSITETGDLKIKGNPKIAYATMMLVRKIIACGYPRVLGQAVTIAGKYSMIRKQFKDDSGKEIPILDYQLQQNKILSCLADYYCIAMNGRILNELADTNFKLVTEKDDDSLMAETHNCLCLGKALSTDILMKDVEICRLACGGHGFSMYSGLPTLLTENSPMTTL